MDGWVSTGGGRSGKEWRGTGECEWSTGVGKMQNHGREGGWLESYVPEDVDSR